MRGATVVKGSGGCERATAQGGNHHQGVQAIPAQGRGAGHLWADAAGEVPPTDSGSGSPAARGPTPPLIACTSRGAPISGPDSGRIRSRPSSVGYTQGRAPGRPPDAVLPGHPTAGRTPAPGPSPPLPTPRGSVPRAFSPYERARHGESAARPSRTISISPGSSIGPGGPDCRRSCPPDSVETTATVPVDPPLIGALAARCRDGRRLTGWPWQVDVACPEHVANRPPDRADRSRRGP